MDHVIECLSQIGLNTFKNLIQWLVHILGLIPEPIVLTKIQLQAFSNTTYQFFTHGAVVTM